MSVIDFLNRFSPTQRIAAMLLVGGILLGILMYTGQPEVAVAPPAAVVPPGALAAPSQPQLPQGYAPGQVLRDPFAVPPEYQKSKAVPPPGGMTDPTGNVLPGQPPKTAALVLQGVVGNAGNWRAIIQYAGESRSYAVNDFAGPYQIQAITFDSVTLTGGGSPLVLTVGRR